MIHDPLLVAGRSITPPFLLAPMAGISHSGFRRLLADFGGYGALFTEMISASALVSENVATSPFTRRRPCEGKVIYQLRLTGEEKLAPVFARLEGLDPFGIDINLGCPAPEIRKCGAGVELFDDRERLARVLEEARSICKGALTVKCRLGKPADNWEETFADRIRLFENIGIDAVTLHPRFSDEKLKRRARWELFPWVKSLTNLPIIANGDITTRAHVETILASGGSAGIMVGRMAAVKPWIFTELSGDLLDINYREIWERFFSYVMEDFPPEKAIGRIKEFNAYFARNFIFGHQLFKAVQGARDLAAVKERAVSFLSSTPAVEKSPSVMGI